VLPNRCRRPGGRRRSRTESPAFVLHYRDAGGPPSRLPGGVREPCDYPL